MIFFAGLVAGWLSFLFFLFLIGRGDDENVVTFEVNPDGDPHWITFNGTRYAIVDTEMKWDT